MGQGKPNHFGTKKHEHLELALPLNLTLREAKIDLAQLF
jgi:hypothetical protein